MNDKNSDFEHKPLVVPEASPMAVIQYAIAEGADLEKLEKLMELQRKDEQWKAKKAYHKAMAAFKKDPPQIDKDCHVNYQTSKGKTSYKHASLANVTEKIG